MHVLLTVFLGLAVAASALAQADRKPQTAFEHSQRRQKEWPGLLPSRRPAAYDPATTIGRQIGVTQDGCGEPNVRELEPSAKDRGKLDALLSGLTLRLLDVRSSSPGSVPNVRAVEHGSPV